VVAGHDRRIVLVVLVGLRHVAVVAREARLLATRTGLGVLIRDDVRVLVGVARADVGEPDVAADVAVYGDARRLEDAGDASRFGRHVEHSSDVVVPEGL